MKKCPIFLPTWVCTLLFLVAIFVSFNVAMSMTGCSKKPGVTEPPTTSCPVLPPTECPPILTPTATACPTTVCPEHRCPETKCPTVTCPTLVPLPSAAPVICPACQPVVCPTVSPSTLPPNTILVTYEKKVDCVEIVKALQQIVKDQKTTSVQYLDQVRIVHPSKTGTVDIIRECYLLKN